MEQDEEEERAPKRRINRIKSLNVNVIDVIANSIASRECDEGGPMFLDNG